MNDITYTRYSPDTSSNEVTAQLVACYRSVFAESPWNEWLRCPVCNKYWGIRDGILLSSWKFQHCGTDLQEFWSQEQISSDLEHEITMNTSCWIAMDGEKVIGFCWGYPITISDLEKKLGITLNSRSETEQLIAYQDEVGVLSEFRNRKIAKTMVRKRLNDFEKQGLLYGIVRTRELPESSQTFLWYKNLGYEILTRYPDGRVILGRSLVGLKKLLGSA